jgi:hypothetical protein
MARFVLALRSIIDGWPVPWAVLIVKMSRASAPRVLSESMTSPVLTKALAVPSRSARRSSRRRRNPCGPASTRQRNEAGERVGLFRAYDKMTGADVGAVEMPNKQTGSPMTCMINGKQYIVVAVSGVDSAQLIAYALP